MSDPKTTPKSKSARKLAIAAEKARRANKEGGNEGSNPQTPETEPSATPDQAQSNAPLPSIPTQEQLEIPEPKETEQPKDDHGLSLKEEIEKLKKVFATFQQEHPVEKRLGDLFDLKLKTAAMKLGQGIGETAASAAEMAKKASENANTASENAAKAIKIAESAKEMIDHVLKVANEVLDNVTIVTEAVAEMRQIGDYVDKKSNEMEKLATTVSTKINSFQAKIANTPDTSDDNPQPQTGTKTGTPWRRG